jgi:hypothetical protein
LLVTVVIFSLLLWALAIVQFSSFLMA